VQLLSLPPLSPTGHLAWEEAALDAVDAGEASPLLWFWESTVPFVVLGYGQAAAREAHLAQCQADGIPVLRRCSGGGAVVQGPGCLNYGLALLIEPSTPTGQLSSTNAWVMDRQRAALQPLISETIVRQGDTDLVIGDRKFSGNAQRRKQRALLFHGTLLLDFDLTRIPRWLSTPSSEPRYRAGRTHLDFVRNLHLPSGNVRAALAQAWDARLDDALLPRLSARADALLASRYADPTWHLRR
jgi:lipoate-protein ligase A